MAEIGKELKKYFDRQGITQVDIAETLGTSKAYVNGVFTGKNILGKRAAEKWSENFGLSRAWLLTGEGPMLMAGETNVSHDEQLLDNTSPPQTSLNPQENSGVASLMSGMKDMLISVVRENNENIKQLVVTMMEQFREHDADLIAEQHAFEERLLLKITESLGAELAHQDMGDIKAEQRQSQLTSASI